MKRQNKKRRIKNPPFRKRNYCPPISRETCPGFLFDCFSLLSLFLSLSFFCFFWSMLSSLGVGRQGAYCLFSSFRYSSTATLPSKSPTWKFKNKITRDDILDLSHYQEGRKEILVQRREYKNLRRIHLGPDATLRFENFDSLWVQIHEMLLVENGGDEQIDDEIEAYSDLIPTGSDFVATMMFEIDNKIRRNKVLYDLGYVEDHFYMDIAGERTMAVPVEEDRTAEDGKTSSVHFLRFPLNPNQMESLKQGKESTDVVLGCDHPKYSHMTRLSAEAVTSLIGDLNH